MQIKPAFILFPLIELLIVEVVVEAMTDLESSSKAVPTDIGLGAPAVIEQSFDKQFSVSSSIPPSGSLFSSSCTLFVVMLWGSIINRFVWLILWLFGDDEDDDDELDADIDDEAAESETAAAAAAAYRATEAAK